MIQRLKQIAVLGSTGSIGTSTLDVIRRWPDRFRVFALVAGKSLDVLVPQIREFHPSVVVVGTQTILENLITRLAEAGIPRKQWPELSAGPEARVQAAIAEDVDFVLSAIVGVEGLEATYQAVRKRKTI